MNAHVSANGYRTKGIRTCYLNIPFNFLYAQILSLMLLYNILKHAWQKQKALLKN
jgi:hypothetical protein